MKITVSPTDRPYETFEIEVGETEEPSLLLASPFTLDIHKLFNIND